MAPYRVVVNRSAFKSKPFNDLESAIMYVRNVLAQDPGNRIIEVYDEYGVCYTNTVSM
jgi:hypothetical protein